MTEYETVALQIDTDEATALITDQIKGLNLSDSEEGVKLRTSDGLLVAVLRETEDDGSELRYRAGTSLTAGPSTRKSQKIRELVEEYTTTESA